MEMSLIDLWHSMGWFAKGIVILLVFMSVYVATIALAKFLQFSRSRSATIKFSGAFSKALSTANFAEAEKLVNANPKSHLANAFRRVFPTLTHHAKDAVLTPAEIGSVQRIIELNTLEQVSGFRRGLGVLATVGATAPFVGLLGTTMGVVNAFTGMANAGNAGMAAISAGIAEALITTAIGIGVALPGVWLYNYFNNRIDYISMEITYATKEFMDFLMRYEANMGGAKRGKGESVVTAMEMAAQ